MRIFWFASLLLSCFLFSPSVNAQTESETPRSSNRSMMVGIGFASSYDTYLSPVDYDGMTLGATFEAINPTRLAGGKIINQHLLSFSYAETRNPADNASLHVLTLDYTFGMLHKINLPINKLRFYAGANVNGLFGGIVKSYGGNNPATPKINLNLGLSAIAVYPFKIGNTPLYLRYQLNLPVLGMMYAHEYGESYYEIDLKGYENLFHFASFHNQFLIKNRLVAELQLNPYTLSIGYENNYYGTRINDLKTRILSSTFYLGLSWNFQLIPSKKFNSKQVRYIFD